MTTLFMFSLKFFFLFFTATFGFTPGTDSGVCECVDNSTPFLLGYFGINSKE